MLEDPAKSPETIKEVGIHLGYISKDVAELKDLIKEQSDHYVTFGFIEALKAEADAEHKDYRERIASLEAKTTSYPLIEKVVFAGVGLVLISVLGAIVGLVILK